MSRSLRKLERMQLPFVWIVIEVAESYSGGRRELGSEGCLPSGSIIGTRKECSSA